MTWPWPGRRAWRGRAGMGGPGRARRSFAGCWPGGDDRAQRAPGFVGLQSLPRYEHARRLRGGFSAFAHQDNRRTVGRLRARPAS